MNVTDPVRAGWAAGLRESEQAVVGAAMADTAAAQAAATAGLVHADFEDPGHRAIWAAIAEGLAASGGTDLVDVYTRLQKAGQVDDCGGLKHLHELSSGGAACIIAGQPQRVLHHVKRIQQAAHARRLLGLAEDFASGRATANGVAHAQAALLALQAAVPDVGGFVLPLSDGQAAWTVPETISDEELIRSKLAPRCIVENYLYADVASLVAPGGTSKTTMGLHESICIALGRPVWGMAVREPGPVLIITAEDRREFLVARLREIATAMRLTPEELDRVKHDVRIFDCTGSVRRLTAIKDDVVEVADFAAELVRGCLVADFHPALVQIDPMVSFGVGESRVNDAEQGLINAARVIVAGLDCAVRFVHHTGQSKALDKASHQYAGRGGSAMSDGCRMVHVLASVNAADLLRATGQDLDEGESAFMLSRPKISYAPPQTAPIYVRRKGYGFSLLQAATAGDREEQAETERLERERELRGAVLDAVETAHRQGLPLSTRLLTDRVHGFKSEAKRSAIGILIAEGWLIEARVPPGWRPINNSRRTWIVRLDSAEREAYRTTGELPAVKLMPPPSIALPPTNAAEGLPNDAR